MTKIGEGVSAGKFVRPSTTRFFGDVGRGMVISVASAQPQTTICYLIDGLSSLVVWSHSFFHLPALLALRCRYLDKLISGKIDVMTQSLCQRKPS